MFNIFKAALGRYKLCKRLKRAVKKKGALSFRVRSVRDFLGDLERSGLVFCVLRWPDSIPLDPTPALMSKTEIDEAWGDVDLLVELGEDGRRVLLEVGARHLCENGVRCDFYCTYGSRGFSYQRFPYYPPIMARDMLRQRMRDSRGFYRLEGDVYIESLAYHLLYHKAAALCPSGSGEGCEQIAGYLERFRAEANKEHVDIPELLTPGTLQAWLEARSKDMPFDLKVRWPLNAGWLGDEISRERKELQQIVDGFNYFCVFVLRDDLEEAGLLDQAIAKLAEHFVIRGRIPVGRDARLSIAARLRGGNWMEGSQGAACLPCMFLLCDDLNPQAVFQYSADYPHLDNLNMLEKHRLREALSTLAGRRIYGVHSSDNQEEAAYMLAVLREANLAC